MNPKLLTVLKDALQILEQEEKYEVCELIHNYMLLQAAQ